MAAGCGRRTGSDDACAGVAWPRGAAHGMRPAAGREGWDERKLEFEMDLKVVVLHES